MARAPITLSVGDAPAQLRAAVLAVKAADNAIRRDISGRMRETMNPAWRSEVSQHLTGAGRMEGRMLTAGVRIAGGNPPALVAASSRRKVGNGLVPDVHAAGWEFGANGTTYSEVTNRRGTKYRRRTMRHLPRRTPKGRVVYPAAAQFLPRVAAFWAQSVIRAFMDAAEGKD